MGRNMFGPIGGGAWGDEQWTGWWGDEPTYHYPVFILTHHQRDPVVMGGGPRSTSSPTESSPRSTEADAAGGKDVMLWGGGQAAQQYLAAGLLDELELHVVPVVLGDGSRLFDNLGTRRCSRAGPGRRGARRHPPQVQEREMKRVAERP